MHIIIILYYSFCLKKLVIFVCFAFVLYNIQYCLRRICLLHYTIPICVTICFDLEILDSNLRCWYLDYPKSFFFYIYSFKILSI